jgi:hypothetical protein
MTYLEAIKGKLNYPLSENSFILALEDRGLVKTDSYVKGEAFDLAYADTIVILLTSPDIKEGSYSVTSKEFKTLTSIASGIFSRYGVANPLSSLKPTAKFVQRW